MFLCQFSLRKIHSETQEKEMKRNCNNLTFCKFDTQRSYGNFGEGNFTDLIAFSWKHSLRGGGGVELHNV